jgi:magnesium-transporting ATPase (P-type)
MITGDNKITATAIAIECGIINKDNKNSLVLEGPEFSKMVGGVVCQICRT